MQSIHDQQQNINSSSRSLKTKVKMANCIFGYQVKKTKLSNFSHVYTLGIFARFHLVEIS